MQWRCMGPAVDTPLWTVMEAGAPMASISGLDSPTFFADTVILMALQLEQPKVVAGTTSNPLNLLIRLPSFPQRSLLLFLTRFTHF